MYDNDFASWQLTLKGTKSDEKGVIKSIRQQQVWNSITILTLICLTFMNISCTLVLVSSLGYFMTLNFSSTSTIFRSLSVLLVDLLLCFSSRSAHTFPHFPSTSLWWWELKHASEKNANLISKENEKIVAFDVVFSSHTPHSPSLPFSSQFPAFFPLCPSSLPLLFIRLVSLYHRWVLCFQLVFNHFLFTLRLRWWKWDELHAQWASREMTKKKNFK